MNSNLTRREKLEALLADEPGDVFLRYGLALELDKEGDHEASLARLSELQVHQPPYVPAFFMAGQQLLRLGKIEEARSALRQGIEEARRQNNSHAAGEMSELLASLGDCA
jgi:thioredoxin-like negative regulator of GroEL